PAPCPATDADNRILADDGRVWEPGMGLDRVQWVANEGIRVAAIVDRVRQAELDDARRQLFQAALTPAAAPARSDTRASAGTGAAAEDRGIVPLKAPPKPEPKQDPPPAPEAPAAVDASVRPDGTVTLTVPIRISLRLDAPYVLATSTAAPDLAGEEAVSIDP